MQPSHRTLPSLLTHTAALSLEGPPGSTTNRDDADMPPPPLVLAPARAASPRSSRAARTMLLVLRHRNRHVAVPLTAARTASPCPSRLYAPRCRASCTSLPSARMFSFFFFTPTSFFATQSPRSHRRWMHSRPPSPGPTTAQLPTATIAARW